MRHLSRPLAFGLAAVVVFAQSAVYNQLPAEVIQSRIAQVTRNVADRKAALDRLFHEAGCLGDQLVEQHVPHSKMPNLVCTLAGETAQTIVVGGHYDAAEFGMGVVDDWSGASLLPSLYQSLKGTPRRHRFVFVGFSGEEDNLLGSTEYVRRLPPDQLPQIRAMINLECLGTGMPEVWAARANRGLLDGYTRAAGALHMETRGMDIRGDVDDDSHPFMTAHIPVLTIHSLTRETFPILHSTRDVLGAIKPDKYYDAYRLAATYLAYLDGKLDQ